MVVTPTPDGRRLPALGTKTALQRFNVAASRAEDQMWLFHSVQLSDLNPDCVRWKLLNHTQDPPAALEEREVGDVRPDILREPFDSLFEQRVYLRLREREYTVIPQHEVNNFRIDLVVVGERSRLAVECDGEAWHGPEQHAHDVARQRDLERCGWRFFRLRESEFYRDPEAALEPLWNLLRERGIWPRSQEPQPTPVEPVEPVEQASFTVQEQPTRAFSLLRPLGPRENPIAPVGSDRESALHEAPPLEDTDRSTVADDGENDDDTDIEEDLDEAVWDSEEDERPVQLGLSAAPNLLGLEPYVSWRSTPQPDPRTAAQAALIDALQAIVAVEGPILARRAYRLMLRASGGQRLGKLTKAPLNRAAAAAVRRGILSDENPGGTQTQIDRILRLPGTPSVRIRARGDRTLEEIPMNEVAALMTRLRSANPRMPPAELRRAVLDAYGLVRMTTKVVLHLDACMSLLPFAEPTP
jgi:very-short-patch-repair endonuclease